MSIEDLKIVAYREEITANFKKREDKFILNTVPNKYDLDEILNFSVGVKFGRQSWACKKKVVLKLSVAYMCVDTVPII